MRPTYRNLVVGDEEQGRVFMAELVESLDYKVETFRDAFGALEGVKLGFDLILFDAKKPGIDGFDLVPRLREQEGFRDIPIIMVTGLDSKEDRLLAVEAGADEFIGKPTRRMELRVRLKSLLHTKTDRDQLKKQRDELKREARSRTEELKNSLRRMAAPRRLANEVYAETLHRLAVAAGYRDECAGALVSRVGGGWRCARETGPPQLAILAHGGFLRRFSGTTTTSGLSTGESPFPYHQHPKTLMKNGLQLRLSGWWGGSCNF